MSGYEAVTMRVNPLAATIVGFGRVKGELDKRNARLDARAS